MDDDELEALAQRKKQEARQEHREERKQKREQAERIVAARVIAAIAYDMVETLDLDPFDFMATVIDSYHNLVTSDEVPPHGRQKDDSVQGERGTEGSR